MRIKRVLAGVLTAMLPCFAHAQQDTQREIERYRQMLVEGNPADLWEARGEELWKKSRGPKSASLEQCDLGLGAGVVKGAYARLPRYFADTDRVQDVESRLVTCMVTLQGFTPEEAMKNPFSSSDRQSVMEALVSYIAAESKGMTLDVPIRHPKEIEALRIGEQLFYRRAGPHDFACVSCHGENGKRIRLQELPKLTDPKDAQKIFTTWPAYRVSQGTVRTIQHRLYDCYWQMRHPQLDYTSEASIALMVYMAKYANGGIINAPGLKR
jgi:L-cysteine S-thiosulfotransferase